MAPIRFLPSLIGLACGGPAVPLDAGFGFGGSGWTGELLLGQGCGGPSMEISLAGPQLYTAGRVPAVGLEDPPGVVWVHFPVVSAMGEGEAALRIQGDEVYLPMGAREGELSLSLRKTGPGLDPGQMDQASTEAQQSVGDAQEAWAAGAYQLWDGEALVGEVRLRAEGVSQVGVYDPLWLTPGGTVAAARQDEGPEVVLAFPVEPSLTGEDALIRLNPIASVAVVPVAPTPSQGDRHLEIRAGVVSDAERAAAVEQAERTALAREAAWAEELGAELAREAAQGGTCLGMDGVDPRWRLLFAGYEVQVVPAPSADRCEVWLEPLVVQHRRRFRGKIGPAGLLP